MCGITGFFAPPRSGSHGEARLQNAVRALHHRGPDAGGVWTSEGVGLGHRRFRSWIFGTWPAADGFAERPVRDGVQRRGLQLPRRAARAGIRGLTFTSSGDTELVLAAIETWGVEAAVRRFIGMFAIAVWDTRRQAAAADSRSPGRQAAVLRLGRQGAVVRFGAQSAPRVRPLAARGRSRARWPTISTTAISTRRAASISRSPSWSRATGSN